MERIKFDLYWEDGKWIAIDPLTGEIKDFEPVKKSRSTKAAKEVDTTPKITLEANKYTLTQGAADLLGVGPDDRLDIKFEKQGKNIIPIIGTNETFGTKGGNKITKSLTVSCRGKANEELSVYGDVFMLTPHPTKEGLFILNGNKEIASVVEDDTVKIDDEEDDVDIKDELDDLLDSEEIDEVKEVTNFDFNI